MDKDKKEIIKEFDEAVNMSPGELENWLETDESKKVGYKENEGDESIGHQSGGKIVEILRKNQDEYSDEDFEHMQKVVGYVHRHSAQRPDGDVTETPWRYSLMNWGHDPEK